MSKINIELDLNLGGYDYDDNYISLEESIKDEIVKSLSKKIEGNVLNDIKEKALRQVEIRIDEVVNNLLKEMFEKEVIITDKWGDIKKKGSVKEIVKDKIDNVFTENVDGNGKITNYGGLPRVEYLIDKTVKDNISSMTRDLDMKIKNMVKSQMEEVNKEKIAKAVTMIIKDGIIK